MNMKKIFYASTRNVEDAKFLHGIRLPPLCLATLCTNACNDNNKNNSFHFFVRLQKRQQQQQQHILYPQLNLNANAATKKCGCWLFWRCSDAIIIVLFLFVCFSLLSYSERWWFILKYFVVISWLSNWNF